MGTQHIGPWGQPICNLMPMMHFARGSIVLCYIRRHASHLQMVSRAMNSVQASILLQILRGGNSPRHFLPGSPVASTCCNKEPSLLTFVSTWGKGLRHWRLPNTLCPPLVLVTTAITAIPMCYSTGCLSGMDGLCFLTE